MRGIGMEMPDGASAATLLLPDCFKNELSRDNAEANDIPAGSSHQGKFVLPDALAVEEDGVPQTGREGKAITE